MQLYLRRAHISRCREKCDLPFETCICICVVVRDRYREKKGKHHVVPYIVMKWKSPFVIVMWTPLVDLDPKGIRVIKSGMPIANVRILKSQSNDNRQSRTHSNDRYLGRE